jgi:hypothetical protein
VIDAQRRPVDAGAVRLLQAADEDATESLAVAEGQVEALEAAAAVDAGGAVEVPPPPLQLQRVAVGEGVGVAPLPQ